MLKYVSKFAMDILPSVAATIIGAYIVNHYITAKPATDAPAAAVSAANSNKADVRSDGKSLANLPGPGVTAKGISEKAMLEKTAGEKPAAGEKSTVVEKSSDKSAEKPVETASIPAETRRRQPGPRERGPFKSASVPAVEPTVAPEEHRDANELARAAIERLRGSNDGSSRAQEASRIPDPPRVPDAARVVSAPPVSAPVVSSPPPLPPAIMVSTPAIETSPTAAEIDNRIGQLRPPRSRRLRFQPDRSIYAPKRRSRRGESIPTWQKRCCWRRNRFSTRCCRDSPERRRGNLSGFAGDSGKAGSRSLVLGMKIDCARV